LQEEEIIIVLVTDKRLENLPLERKVNQKTSFENDFTYLACTVVSEA
jgi:hypothetical protein